VEFPEVAGYPVGGDFEIKYYMIQMHYDNPTQTAGKSDGGCRWRESRNECVGRRDSSGIRYYIGKERRQHELGYLTLGMDSYVLGLTIPPRVDQFIVDSYCPANATQVKDYSS
jgi:hypothetical protein